MFKQKRKNDELPRRTLVHILFNAVHRILVITGLVTVIVLALLALLVWPFTTPKTYPYRPYQYPTLTPIPFQTLAPDMRLALVTSRSEIFTNTVANAGQFRKSDTYANSVSYSPDHRWIVELSNVGVRLTSSSPSNQEVFERFVQIQGTPLMPAWNADSDMVMFVVRQGDTNILYSLSLKNPTLPIPRLIVRALLAPPLFHPATGRVLIAQPTAAGGTSLDTMDPNCAGLESCRTSLRTLATIPQMIDWATFHPNATTLIVSSMGKLYQVATATGETTPFLRSGDSMYQPVFNRDGTLLAYLSAGKVHILRLSDSSTTTLTFNDVMNVAWAD